MRYLLLVVVLLIAVAGASDAYTFNASARATTGGALPLSIVFGDSTNSSASQMINMNGTIVLALPSDQSWQPHPGASTPIWNRTMMVNPGPEMWTIAIWGINSAASTVDVTFWIPVIGGGSSGIDARVVGAWRLQNLKTRETVWTGMADSTKNAEYNPWFTVTLPVVNTGTPQWDAEVYIFTPSLSEIPLYTPEPASLLTLLAGASCVGGFIIRKRKA